MRMDAHANQSTTIHRQCACGSCCGRQACDVTCFCPHHEFKGLKTDVQFECKTSPLSVVDGKIQVPTGKYHSWDIDEQAAVKTVAAVFGRSFWRFVRRWVT